MSYPRVFWPNRKSAIGLRNCSKTPRSFGRVFVTQPPIAEDPMRQLIAMTPAEDEERKMMREALTSIAGIDFGTARSDRETSQLSDKEIVAAALRRFRGALEDESARTRREVANLMALKAETEEGLRKVRDEHEAARAVLVADMRKLRDQVDEDKIQLRILYAVDEACAARDAEIKTLRADVAERDSRIAELERSKKKLREAMQRLSDKV